YGTQLVVDYDNLILQPVNGKGLPTTVTVATATKFNSGVTPNVNDVRATLSKIPATSDPTKGPPTATTTPTPTTTSTATVKASGTPATGQRPAVTVTPTVTPT